MDDYESLSHSKWECKYHVVFIPKYREKAIFGAVKKRLGDGSMIWRGAASAK